MSGDGLDEQAWKPVRVVAAAMMIVCLGLGIVLGQMTAPAASTAEQVAHIHLDDDAASAQSSETSEIDTDVLGAVATNPAALTPTSVDHLVIVTIAVTTCGERASGTGFLIAENTILTAAHNVGDAGLVRVGYGSQVFTGEVAGVFADGRDLAIIELPAPLDPPVATNTAITGSAATIVGFPEGGAQASVVGAIVEVPGRAQQLWEGPLVAVDASTRAGMSGGPAVDPDGNLIGVLVAAQPETGTAIVAAIDDIAQVRSAPLVDGRCPTTA